MATQTSDSKANAALEFQRQAGKLSLHPLQPDNDIANAGAAVQARFVTPQDPVIETADGSRLPPVPLQEAYRLNQLRNETGGPSDTSMQGKTQSGKDGREHASERRDSTDRSSDHNAKPDASFRTSVPPSRTHPLFPQLPLYGPPTLLRDIQSFGFRCSSAFLSLCFLSTIVLGSAFTSIPLMFRHVGQRLRFRDPDARRPHYEEEKRRSAARKEEANKWTRSRRGTGVHKSDVFGIEEGSDHYVEFEPTEGGPDPLVCNVGYYARRVGLDVKEYAVQTEDGFIIELLHLYNPKEHKYLSDSQDTARDTTASSYGANSAQSAKRPTTQTTEAKRKYPVLLLHGLLQSAGAYCANDDDSLAFFLCKSGYDVWLGNNRCGFQPQHQVLHYTDPRMWNWNIRQMGVMDLPALVSRVLDETGFPKLGLICHSQGTTETFVALAKEQRPDLGNKISVFCALAPAGYAGPLIGKMYFKFMRIISPGMFRIMFGIHAFIPFMMTMHAWLPGRLYGAMGYRVFSFLFNWTDDRWDQGIRDRLFQFAPVYVSAESMRWWLGRECFATQKCILATREEGQREDEEDEAEDYYVHSQEHSTEHMLPTTSEEERSGRGQKAWYDEQVPPFALWIGGSDELVDGRRLLRRFERRREPHVRVVHSKIIEEYEHLDVLWAIDAVEKVAREVREVLWKTAPTSARESCRVPKQCEAVEAWERD